MCCIEWWKGSIFDALRTRWVNYKTIFSERRRLTWAPGASACARMIEPLTSLSSSHCSGFQCNGTIKVLGPLLPPQNPSVTHSGTMSCRGGQYPPVVKQCLRPSNTIHLQDCHSFEKKKSHLKFIQVCLHWSFGSMRKQQPGSPWSISANKKGLDSENLWSTWMAQKKVMVFEVLPVRMKEQY